MRKTDPCPWCDETPCAKTCRAGALNGPETAAVIAFGVAVLAVLALLVLIVIRVIT